MSMTKYAAKKKGNSKKSTGDNGQVGSRSPSPNRGCPPEGCPGSQTLRSWAQEVLQVLDKPTVAVCIFIFGVIIIVVASKQLKVTFDIIEYYWGGGRPQDGFIGNFMIIFVFIYVWLDTVILQWMKKLALHLHAFAYRRYSQLVEALEKIQEEDDFEELERRRLLRRKKTVIGETKT